MLAWFLSSSDKKFRLRINFQDRNEIMDGGLISLEN